MELGDNMYKNNEELNRTLNSLLIGFEDECVEFKRAKNEFDIDKLGKYFSAISNEATLKNKQYGWIIFGIDDKTHEICGTNYNYDNNFNRVKKQIADNTTDNASFIEIYLLNANEKRVIMFQVPATSGIPMNWKGFPYGRTGESLVPLEHNKIEQIRSIINYDWSRQIIESASINNLDKDAILKARDQFKIKYDGKAIANDIDKLSDTEFLNKAKITIDGKITKAAMLLLGKYDDDHLIEDYQPKITWKLYDENNVVDYEHFGIPFIINVEKAKDKIRNLRYRYMVNKITLFPNEVDQYDNYILRELLNNCIVHQNYRLQGIINIIEYKDKITITNEGQFIPINVENVLKDGFSSPYYRNQFLANAMVNLNMIDTVGSGIKRIYNIQKEKFFPLPDYDLTDGKRVSVTLYGKILDEKYTKILFEKTELNISQVILLDKVQKKHFITKEQSDYLKKDKLIEGRYPNIYICSTLAKITDEKAKYIQNKGLDNDYYKNLILAFIKEFKSARREDIFDFLDKKLPNYLDEKGKINRIRYLISELKKENKIRFDHSSDVYAWVLEDSQTQ